MFRYSRRWVVGYIEIVKDDSALFCMRIRRSNHSWHGGKGPISRIRTAYARFLVVKQRRSRICHLPGRHKADQGPELYGLKPTSSLILDSTPNATKQDARRGIIPCHSTEGKRRNKGYDGRKAVVSTNSKRGPRKSRRGVQAQERG